MGSQVDRLVLSPQNLVIKKMLQQTKGTNLA